MNEQIMQKVEESKPEKELNELENVNGTVTFTDEELSAVAGGKGDNMDFVPAGNCIFCKADAKKNMKRHKDGRNGYYYTCTCGGGKMKHDPLEEEYYDYNEKRGC